MQVIRKVKSFTLLKRGKQYWVDNGQEVTEYLDEFDCKCLLKCSDEEFLREAKLYF